MSSKPIWESRFRGLVSSIDSHRQSSDSRLAAMTVNAAGEKINTAEYWKELGKYELLVTLEKVCKNWERTDWF